VRSTQTLNKRVGPWLAFGDDWFAAQQDALLRMANSRVTGPAFRRLLRLPLNQRILRLGPQFVQRPGQFQFHSHPKFAKRLYYGLKPAWWALHGWDWAIADRWMPSWSMGLTTLEAYPEPSGGSVTMDGRCYESTDNQAWATKRGAANGTVAVVNETTLGVTIREDLADPGTNWNSWGRVYLLFDTSPIGAGVDLISATLGLMGQSKLNQMNFTDNQYSTCLVTSNPTSNTTLAVGDYNITKFGATRLAADLAYSVFSASSLNNIALNAYGLAAVSTSAVTKFGMLWNADRDNTEPSGFTRGVHLDAKMVWYAADQTGTSNDPILTINYSATPTSGKLARNVVMGPVRIG